MIGLSGSLLTSATGAKIHGTPAARASIAVMRPTAYASAVRPVAATAIACGNEVPSHSRIAVPCSKSPATSNGIFARCCSKSTSAAVPYTWLRLNPNPPGRVAIIRAPA